MLGVMWPDVRVRFGQSLGALGLVTLSYGLGRLSTAVTGRGLVGRFGTGRALMGALAALALACAVIASAVSWPLFLAGAGALGMVSGALDSIGSTFIAGRANVADAGLLHGFYGLGATIGPLVVALVSNWRAAAATAVAVSVGAAVMTSSVNAQWPTPQASDRTGFDSAVEVPSAAVAASVLALGALVAIEVTTGQWAFTYLTDARNISDTGAAIGVAGFWGASTLGRLMMAHPTIARLVRHIGLPALAAAAAVTLIGVIAGPAWLSVALVALAGFFLAPIVPTLFATTAHRVGTAAALRVSGWQLVATNVGALSVPAAIGVLVEAEGPEVIPLVAVAVLAAVGVPLLVAITRLLDRLVPADRV